MSKAIKTVYRVPNRVTNDTYVASDMDKNTYIHRVTLEHQMSNTVDYHAEAARGLIRKMGWHGSLTGGWLERGVMVWTFNNPYTKRIRVKKSTI